MQKDHKCTGTVTAKRSQQPEDIVVFELEIVGDHPTCLPFGEETVEESLQHVTCVGMGPRRHRHGNGWSSKAKAQSLRCV